MVRVVEGPPPEGWRRVGGDPAENLGLYVEREEDSLQVWLGADRFVLDSQLEALTDSVPLTVAGHTAVVPGVSGRDALDDETVAADHHAVRLAGLHPVVVLQPDQPGDNRVGLSETLQVDVLPSRDLVLGNVGPPLQSDPGGELDVQQYCSLHTGAGDVLRQSRVG